MRFSLFALATIAQFLFFCSTAFATPVDRFVVVVPVYRELYNQNIGTVLMSLYNQNLEGQPFDKIEVVFVVNNTKDVDPDVRIENQETVQFLRDLAVGKTPVTKREHRVLQKIGMLPIASKLKISVIDRTTPGEETRNIGRIRQYGLNEALKHIPEAKRENALIAQMDADTVFRSDYLKTAVAAFNLKKLRYVLLNMYYEDQVDSEKRVYQRKVTTDYQAAGYSYIYAVNKDMPGGGGPRVIATAQALVEVGGVPNVTVGEDVALIQNLRKKFPQGGTYLNNPVYAKYRAREDGYDAAHYKRALNREIVFGEKELEATKHLNEHEHYYFDTPELRALFAEAYDHELKEYLSFVTKLKNIVRILIQDKVEGNQTISPEFAYPALINNPWFNDEVTLLVKKHNGNETAILSELAEIFPYHFSDPPNEIMREIMRLRAAASTLMIKNLLEGTTDSPLHAAYRVRYPKSAGAELLSPKPPPPLAVVSPPAIVRNPIAPDAREQAVREGNFAYVPIFTAQKGVGPNVAAFHQGPDYRVPPGPGGRPDFLNYFGAFIHSPAAFRSAISAPNNWPQDMIPWNHKLDFKQNVAVAMSNEGVSDELINDWTRNIQNSPDDINKLVINALDHVASKFSETIEHHDPPIPDFRRYAVALNTLLRRSIAIKSTDAFAHLVRTTPEKYIEIVVINSEFATSLEFIKWREKKNAGHSKAPANWPHDAIKWLPQQPYESNLARAMADEDISQELISDWCKGVNFQDINGVMSELITAGIRTGINEIRRYLPQADRYPSYQGFISRYLQMMKTTMSRKEIADRRDLLVMITINLPVDYARFILENSQWESHPEMIAWRKRVGFPPAAVQCLGLF